MPLKLRLDRLRLRLKYAAKPAFDKRQYLVQTRVPEPVLGLWRRPSAPCVLQQVTADAHVLRHQFTFEAPRVLRLRAQRAHNADRMSRALGPHGNRSGFLLMGNSPTGAPSCGCMLRHAGLSTKRRMTRPTLRGLVIVSALCETARSQKVAVNCFADLMLTQSPVCTSVVRKLLPLALVPPAP